MRITYLHQYYNRPDMPGSTRSHELARRLAERGHEVTMVTSDRSGAHGGWSRSTESGINVHWLAVPYSNGLSYQARIRSFFRFAVLSSVRAASIPADLVLATSTPLTIALPGMFASSVRRCPFVLEVRDLWPSVPIQMGVLRNPISVRAASALERAAYGRASGVVALSPGMADHVMATSPTAVSTVVIPNGADIRVFGDDSAEGGRVREQHDWLGSRPLVVYAGTLGHVNAPREIVELAAGVAEVDPEVRFAVVGSGREEVSLRSHARARGVLERTLYMVGPVDKSSIPAWLAAADVTLSTIRPERYFWENAVTNKFFDSLAAGRPVIANHWGWQSEVAQAHECGLVLEDFASPSSAHELVSLLRDRERLTAMGRRSRELAETRFSFDILADQLEAFITAVADEHGASS